jgi:signal transduction histidine kinase
MSTPDQHGATRRGDPAPSYIPVRAHDILGAARTRSNALRSARTDVVPLLQPASPPDRRARVRLPMQGFGWAGMLVTLLFTLGYWRYSVIDLERRAHDRFAQLAERQVAVLIDRMHDHERVLLGARGLFAASTQVVREEWRAYVNHLELEATLPGFQGVGFAQVVPRASRAAHERAVRAQGFHDYSIRPEGVRDPYTSIVLLEPFTGRNLRAFGYDMYSEPTRRVAMNRARDTGEPALTHKVTLVQESDVDVQAGFLIYLPVYDRGRPAQTIEERRDALIGWVYSPCRADDLMNAVFGDHGDHGDHGDDAEVEVFDGAPSPRNLLYATPNAGRDAAYSVDHRVTLGGIGWMVRLRSSEAFESRIDPTGPQLVLLSGVLLSLLIFSLLYAEMRYRAQLQSQVRERTLELEYARDEAEGASRAKSAFLATVSHELRTPLNAIIGFSSILLQGDLAAEQRKQLGIINRSGLQLLDLIKEILDITSIEAGQLSLEAGPVHLRGVLEEQCEVLQGQAREVGLYLRLAECDPSVIVVADRGRLGQVVRNLLSNAVKFTDRGGVTVRCEVNGATVVVEVEDTGIGIPAEQRSTVFVPFQRGDKQRAHRPGTGLGLAISRRLVEAMGGHIGFESVVGKGTRFWFTLPVARGQVRSGRK